MDKLNKVPKPVGKFILDNAEGTQTDTGTYYHYSEVCSLVKNYHISEIEYLKNIINDSEASVSERMEMLKDKLDI